MKILCNRAFCYCCACSFLLGASGVSRAASPIGTPTLAPAASTDARAGIQSAYDGLNAAFEERNLDKFMSYFTADYAETGTDGAKIDKAGARKHYQTQLNRITSMHNRYAIGSLTPTEAGAQVEMTMHSDGTGVKRIFFARFKGTFTSDIAVRDLWVPTPQGWRLKCRQMLQNETHIHPG